MSLAPGLGCTNHSVMVYDRGGFTRLFELTDVARVSWQRMRDHVSLAEVVVTSPSPECRSMLDQIEPARHEMVIFRAGQRVWEGPITLLVEEGGSDATISIQARDVLHYAHRLIMRSGYSNAYPNVDTTVERAERILRTELARRETEDPPINVLPHLLVVNTDDDARTTRISTPYEKTVFDEMDAMSAFTGLDYTVVGRRIVLFDRYTPLGRTPVVTQSDFLGDVRITVYGMEMATYAAVTGGNGQFGVAGDPNGHPYYGLWEILDSAYDEEEGGDLPSQRELDSQAARNISGRVPTPVVVRLPDGSGLNPNGVLTMENLVPGVQVPLRADLAIRRVSQVQKLSKVQVTDDASGEKIMITLVPRTAAENIAAEED